MIDAFLEAISTGVNPVSPESSLFKPLDLSTDCCLSAFLWRVKGRVA